MSKIKISTKNSNVAAEDLFTDAMNIASVIASGGILPGKNGRHGWVHEGDTVHLCPGNNDYWAKVLSRSEGQIVVRFTVRYDDEQSSQAHSIARVIAARLKTFITYED